LAEIKTTEVLSLSEARPSVVFFYPPVQKARGLTVESFNEMAAAIGTKEGITGERGAHGTGHM